MTPILGIIASSQVPAWTPNNLANLKAWWDASDTSTITASSNAVSQWNDKSANAYNVSQATASYQPTSGVSTLNSLNVITFDGNDGLFNTTKANWKFLHDGTKVLMGAVLKPGNVSNPDTFYCWMATNESGSSIGLFQFWDDRGFIPRNNKLIMQTGNGSGGSPVQNEGADNQLPANAWDYATFMMDATNASNTARSEIKTDAATSANNNDNYSVSSSDPQRNFCIGSWATDTTGTTPTATYGWTGGIAEIVIATGTDVTTANRDKLATYLKDKWGV